MTQGQRGLVIVQRPCLLLVISTPRLANQSHDSVPLTNIMNILICFLQNKRVKNKEIEMTERLYKKSEKLKQVQDILQVKFYSLSNNVSLAYAIILTPTLRLLSVSQEYVSDLPMH